MHTTQVNDVQQRFESIQVVEAPVLNDPSQIINEPSNYETLTLSMDFIEGSNANVDLDGAEVRYIYENEELAPAVGQVFLYLFIFTAVSNSIFPGTYRCRSYRRRTEEGRIKVINWSSIQTKHYD